MKYTRYDLNNKKKKNERKNLLLSILGISIVAIIIGTVLAPFLFKGSDKDQSTSGKPATEEAAKEPPKNDNKPVQNENKDNVVPSDDNKTEQNYVMIQCGYYSKKENADNILNKIKDKGIAVSVKEEDKFRVIAYIGDENEAQKLSDELTSSEISNTKVRFNIPKTDVCNSEIIEIINGYLKILNKFKDKEVKGVKTNEFKEWTNSLKEESNNPNFKIFKELKDAVNNLPDEINKDNIEESYKVVYKVLNNFRVEK